ncbi:hypothetical protein ACL02T_02780 [Pseudonocardia sp. RS010]|uniref:hypothetical protein n=1 Tax=Pseudonocardia sp. RS010 TaxID=3385979 RepID=UPI00399F9690
MGTHRQAGEDTAAANGETLPGREPGSSDAPTVRGGTGLGGAALAAVARAEGFLAACLVDPGSGTVLDSRPPSGTEDLGALAAGAADLMHVLTVMDAQLAVEAEVEDVVVTTARHLHLVRVLEPAPDETRLLVVTLDRSRCRLAVALRELRDAGVRGAC